MRIRSCRGSTGRPGARPRSRAYTWQCADGSPLPGSASARCRWTRAARSRSSSRTGLRCASADVEARLDRFFDVVAPALADDLDRVEYVDLRYTNGFAVGWTEQAPETRLSDVMEGGPRA